MFEWCVGAYFTLQSLIHSADIVEHLLGDKHIPRISETKENPWWFQWLKSQNTGGKDWGPNAPEFQFEHPWNTNAVTLAQRIKWCMESYCVPIDLRFSLKESQGGPSPVHPSRCLSLHPNLAHALWLHLLLFPLRSLKVPMDHVGHSHSVLRSQGEDASSSLTLWWVQCQLH